MTPDAMWYRENPVPDTGRIYPCDECGVLRSRNERWRDINRNMRLGIRAMYYHPHYELLNGEVFEFRSHPHEEKK